MEELKNKILSILDEKFINHKGIDKLSRILSGLIKANYEDVLLCLKSLEKEGDIYEFTKHKYASSKNLGLVKGKVSYSGQGFSFVLHDEGDIYVSRKNSLNSFDGDIVLVKVLTNAVGGKKREGKILKVLARSEDNIVGTFERIKSYGYVKPDKKKFDRDIFIDVANINGAKDGDKVVVDIINYKSGNPVGKIVEVLGDPNAKGTDIKCLLRQYKVIEHFSQDVLAEARRVPQQIDKEKYAHRRDLTEMMMFTIDGQDAKDLDDAVSLEKNKDGTYLLGVHIADVGEYVKKDGVLDVSAFERGTSIYFLDQVIPMLPKELSNGICSLNPNVERLALSVFMKIDKTGAVIESEICESVIKSKFRLNYDEVLEVLEGNKQTQNRLKEVTDTLLLMLELSEILEKRRNSCGALNFELPEGKVIVDENNKPIKVEKRLATKSTKIIETFMVATNEVVAKKFCELKIPFAYRVHEKPDSEKMTSFVNFLSSLGIEFKAEKKDIEPKDLQAILNKVAELPYNSVVNMVMLRSLKKAKYLEVNLGHFGMALTYYCHFTSPIRRYPDLCIHRIIKEYLRGNKSAITSAKALGFVKKACEKSSDMEKNAEEVERAITDYKKCEYMSQFVGETFEGIISGLNGRGFFVELDNTCEGFVSVSSLKDDFYDYDENTLTLKSKNSFYRIGEKVQVKLVGCVLSERKINFEVIKKIS